MARKRKSDSIEKGIEIANSHKEKITKERNQRLNIENEDAQEYEISSARKTFRVFFVIAIIVGIAIFFNYGPILGIKLFSIERDPIIINNLLSSETVYMEYANELLVYNSGKIFTYDSMGNITWQYNLSESFVPTIYTKGSYMAVVNKNNGMMYFFDSKKETANKIIEGNIENVYINDSGTFIVQYTKSTGYKKVIAAFDKKGKPKYDEMYIDSAPIIGIDFLTDESKLLVVQADSSHINIGTKFSVLDYKENKFSQLSIFDDKLVYNYRLLNDEIFYISDKAVESYSIDVDKNQVVHSLSDNQTNYVALSNNYFTIVETVSEGSKIIMKRFDDSDISSNTISSYPKFIENSGLLTYVVSENNIFVINKWGVMISEISISLSPKRIIVFNQEKSAALIYSNKVEIVSI